MPALQSMLRAALAVAVLAGVAAGAYFSRARWEPFVFPRPGAEEAHDDHGPVTGTSERLILTEQAQKNLRLTTVPLTAGTFWKTAALPGMVIDRPGVTDHAVVAPVAGVVAKVFKTAGEAVRPGDVLFVLRPRSEGLYQAQTELLKAVQGAEQARAQRKLLAAGDAAAARVMEADNQIARFDAAARAYRQELAARGLTPDQVEAAAAGAFATELRVLAPARPDTPTAVQTEVEVQELKAELGRFVEAGQTLALLADHRLLAVEGQAFPDEAPALERAARGGWPVEVEFGDDGWPPHGQEFRVTHVANVIDPETRTFRFRFNLANQSRGEGDGHAEWRFRPGQRVRVRVRTEKLENVFALPAEAVARDGADAYVFRRNGDAFDRKPVHVVYQDRRHAVVANDGSVAPGGHVAATAAAQLNRMAKANSGAAPAGFHIHADGSVHMGNH